MEQLLRFCDRNRVNPAVGTTLAGAANLKAIWKEYFLPDPPGLQGSVLGADVDKVVLLGDVGCC